MKLTIQFSIIKTLFLANLFCVNLIAQDLDYGSKIYRVTAIVYTYSNNTVDQGSSFFYHSDKGDFLVSNRHVLFPKETIPDSIIFSLKQSSLITDKTEWKQIKMDQRYLLENLRLHPNRHIDVASIKLNKLFQTLTKERFYRPYAVTNPDSLQLSDVNPEIGDDVLIIGYPKGYYDEFNKIPIMKSGVIASFFGLQFQNQPCYIVDSKLFPGSSGSIVISKHQPVIIKNGRPAFATKKDFILLGIFSGEPYKLGRQVETDEEIYIRKERFNLGLVWYPSVIDELEQLTVLKK